MEQMTERGIGGWNRQNEQHKTREKEGGKENRKQNEGTHKEWEEKGEK